jgi:hypothetical protein
MEKPDKEIDCCPVFDAARWNDKTFIWENKQFIRGTMPQLLHFSFPGLKRRTLKKLWKQAVDAAAEPDRDDFLMLTHDSSPWKGEIYLPVTQSVPGADNVMFSGTYFTKVFEGPFTLIPQFEKQMDIILSHRNILAKKYFYHSSACPLCGRKHSPGSIVAFAEI